MSNCLELENFNVNVDRNRKCILFQDLKLH